MSHPVYRFSSILSPSPLSLQELSKGPLLAAPRFEGLSCVDMYGDLPFGLFALSNAAVRGDAGYILSGDVPILEQNADFLRNKKFLRPRFHEVEAPRNPTLEVDQLVSLKSRCHNYFWHWMMDSLPKVFLAEDAGFQGSYLIPPPSIAPWALESLRLVGIGDSRICYAESQDVHAHQLYIPTYFCGYNAIHNESFTLAFRDWLLKSLGELPPERNARLFVGRRKAGKARTIRAQEALESLLTEFGFTTVHFEDLSLREQITRACGAEALIGGHGSGFTHTLFMDKGSLVVELFPFKRRQTNDCYQMVSTIVGNRYYGLETPTDCGSDIEVDHAALKDLLERGIQAFQ